MKVRKAVIPAAGLGTRFLPASKSQPKEMLPLVDKPTIQYVVEEAVRAGIDDILIVTGRNKQAVEDHFDRTPELEALLEAKGKHDLLDEVRSIADLAQIHFVRQKEPLGLGHAVGIAERHVAGEPFAVLLGDDVIGERETLLADLIAAYERHGSTVVTALEVENPSRYGVITSGPEVAPDLIEVADVIEKPPPEEAASNLAVIGRYVLDPSIFEVIRDTKADAKGEVQLTDALRTVAHTDRLLALRFDGVRYDAGDKGDYLRATVELAAGREDLGPGFKAWLRQFVAGMERTGGAVPDL